jgi:hypothetical protein
VTRRIKELRDATRAGNRHLAHRASLALHAGFYEAEQEVARLGESIASSDATNVAAWSLNHARKEAEAAIATARQQGLRVEDLPASFGTPTRQLRRPRSSRTARPSSTSNLGARRGRMIRWAIAVAVVVCITLVCTR